MGDRFPARSRPQSLGEEIANSISHGVGALAALGAAPILIVAARRRGDVQDVIAAAVFAGSMLLLYLTSTLYHALPRNTAKRVFRALDHGAIYLLIAGTYTPFTLGVLRGGWGWTLFGLVWSLAILGIVLNAVGGIRYARLSVAFYIAMGWVCLVAVRPLWLHIPPSGLLWLTAGGVAYTAGVAFYALDRRYTHFVWHLFVLAGTSCHFFAALWYAA
jgi:hemolysin III